MKPRICILRTDGTNCDEETFYAFEKVEGESRLVHINQLRLGEENLVDYQILVIPGGFSYGDDVHSGKVLAVELTSFLEESLREFVGKGKLILGICNGFQVLVSTGLLPSGEIGEIKATLMSNDSGRFECRWVNMVVEDTCCVFTEGMAGRTITLQVAHGEGKFYTYLTVLEEIESRKQVVFRYVGNKGRPTLHYPANPNGSLNAIAGICDPTGRILGLMPHPERYIELLQFPNWRREKNKGEPYGLAIFQNAVRYASQM